MVWRKSYVELQSNINGNKSKERIHKHKLFSNIEDHCGSRKVAKTRLGKYKKHRSSSGKSGSFENEVGEVDTDEEAAEDYTYSQELLPGEIFESDQYIEEYSGQLNAVTERVKTYIK